MEKDINQASGDSTKVGDESTNSNDTVSYDSHKKLLIEKKNLQAKFQEQQAELDKFKQSELEATGKHEELISSLRDQLSESQNEAKELKSSFAWKTVKGQIENEALNQGCVNTSAFVKLMSKDDLKSIEVDNDFNVNADDLKRVVEQNKSSFKDIGLFKKEKVNVNDVTSSNTRPPAKPLDELSKDELIAKLYE